MTLACDHHQHDKNAEEAWMKWRTPATRCSFDFYFLQSRGPRFHFSEKGYSCT